MALDSTGSSIPPYVPYSSFINFINELATHLPSHIDKSLMSKMSGSTQSAMLTTLKTLNLINEQSEPTSALIDYVNSSESGRPVILRKIIESTYGFLFEDFNLSSATSKRVEDKFREVGAGGSTLTKCISFFLSAAKEAGIQVSPHVKAPTLSRTNGSNKKKKTSSIDTLEKTQPPEPTDSSDSNVPNGMTKFEIPLKDTENGVIYLPEGLTESQAIKAVKMANFILKSYYEIDED